MKTYSSGQQRERGEGAGGHSAEEAHRKQTRHVFYPSNANAATLLPHSDRSKGGGILFSEWIASAPTTPYTTSTHMHTHFNTTPDFTAG